MTTYFGFVPSETLIKKIDDTIDLVNNRPNEEFYPHQLDITNQVAHELIENLFVKLVDIIEDPKRKEKMQKVVNTVNGAVNTLLKHIITKQKNDKVMDAFNFLLNECLFEDSDGVRRVGYALSSSDANTMVNNFKTAKDKAENNDSPHKPLQDAMDVVINTNIEHFLTNFSQHLHLGMIKRKAVPIADAAISKASKVAIHSLLPEMDNAACMRLHAHFSSFVIEK